MFLLVKIKRFNEAEKKKLQQVESIDKPSLVVIDLQQLSLTQSVKLLTNASMMKDHKLKIAKREP